MNTRCFLLLALFAACTDAATDADMQLASDEAIADKADGSTAWAVAPTLHAGARVFDGATAGGRRIHPIWIAGSTTDPVSLDIEVRGADGYDVRVAILGPLANGVRPVLAADGYATRKHTANVHVSSTLSGEHLVVVGSFGLQTQTYYDVVARCTTAADCDKVDLLSTPKVGALVAMETDRLLAMQLGPVLDDRDFDVEVELFTSAPGQTWNLTHLATSVASGNQVNTILPLSVQPGDDITLVVREAGGRILDTGVLTRFAPAATAFARTDAILYGDIASLQIGGVVGFFEGTAELALHSETYNRDIAFFTAHADMPGAAGIGFGAFDAHFAPDLETEPGILNPNLPRNNELLSVGYINGNGDYRRLGCFEYCNDLAGSGVCTGGPRACP
jgi:hypothetical protein